LRDIGTILSAVKTWQCTGEYDMVTMPRREFIFSSAATLAAFSANFAQASPSRSGETLIPWLDQPPPGADPCCTTPMLWENFDQWITPNEKIFTVHHFDWPVIDAAGWKLEIDGLVNNPMTLTLDDIKARPSQDVMFTLECSGNHGFPDFTTAIGNAEWVGTSLASILEEAGVKGDGIEVAFWGNDVGDITLKDAIRDVAMHQNFARSMSLADAMSPHNILCHTMNDQPLSPAHGFPVRLIAPGWYGIANVKWLKRIEIRDTRFQSLLMARDYVTIREERHNGETVRAETSVGRTRLKSAPGRVTNHADGLRISGAAWGQPIDHVEVQIDDGPWVKAFIDWDELAGKSVDYAWVFWQLDWPDATPGEHRITSRAFDKTGNMQPAMDDPLITGKHTYWESNGQITRIVVIA